MKIANLSKITFLSAPQQILNLIKFETYLKLLVFNTA